MANLLKEQKIYNSARWRNARSNFLCHNPLCVSCMDVGRVTPAMVVHHKVPHDGDWEKFWDLDNWESLCYKCHNTVARMRDIHGFSQSCGVNGVPVDPLHPWNRG